MKTLTLLCMALGLAPVLYGQRPSSPDPRPVPPTGALLNRAPDFAQWTVISKTSVAPAASASPLASPTPGGSPKQKNPPSLSDQTVSVVKTKSIRYEQTVTGAGQKLQKWCLPDMQVAIRESGAPVILFPGRAGQSLYTDYSRADFGGFEWISARNYDGIEKVMGQDCFVFRDKMKLEPGETPVGPPPMAMACIDAESRLPVVLQLGEEIRTYRFGPAPVAMLTLPQAAQNLVDQWRKILHQAALPPAKP